LRILGQCLICYFSQRSLKGLLLTNCCAIVTKLHHFQSANCYDMYELHVPRGEHPKLFWGSVKYLRTDFLHVNIWKRRVSYTGNHIDLRISEMAFLLCAEPFAINISVHDYVYISLCPVILEMWLHKRCKGPNNFSKLKSLERRKWYFQSLIFELKINWYNRSVWSTETMLI
jgi:hypothetical protein